MNGNEPAFPTSAVESPRLMGLTKREYMMIEFAKVYAASPAGWTTSGAVSQAKIMTDELLKQLEDEQETTDTDRD